MNIKKITSESLKYPSTLKRLSSPPKQLFIQGQDLCKYMDKPRIAIIGSRSISSYGRRVTNELAGELAESGIVIISGLALGVDAEAHQSALNVDGLCIAVLPCPLQKIVPRSNLMLAKKIVSKGGSLVTEYGAKERTFKQNFVARNRIMAGLADAILITEATLKSGTMHTARFALEQGIDVMAVPGSVYSPASTGTNSLIKSGAIPVTCSEDVFSVLGLKNAKKARNIPKGSNQQQQVIIDLIASGKCEGEDLMQLCKLSISDYNKVMTMLEITGKIKALGANQWTLI